MAVRGLVGAGGARRRLNATQPGPAARPLDLMLSSHGRLVRGGSSGRAQLGEHQHRGGVAAAWAAAAGAERSGAALRQVPNGHFEFNRI